MSDLVTELLQAAGRAEARARYVGVATWAAVEHQAEAARLRQRAAWVREQLAHAEKAVASYPEMLQAMRWLSGDIPAAAPTERPRDFYPPTGNGGEPT